MQFKVIYCKPIIAFFNEILKSCNYVTICAAIAENGNH